MNTALLSLLALILAVILSGVTRVNVGILALGFAWLVGHYVAGQPIAFLFDSFPLNLASMLFGVTFLFGIAHQNGSLQRITYRAARLVRGRAALMPLVFFVLAVLLSSIGAGNIAAVAILAPMAMATAGEMGISALLMTIMIANGANAGAFSPIAPTGIIANSLIQQIGIEMNPWTQVYLPPLVAQTFVALVSYGIFGGVNLWRRANHAGPSAYIPPAPLAPVTRVNIVTLLSIAAFIVGVIVFKADAGFLAIALATILCLLGMGDQEEAIKAVPWSTILMVCGVSVLIAVLQITGGLDLFTSLLAQVSTLATVTGVIALATALLSVYSSSSGVVMPAFIPLVPGLIARLGGGNPVALVSSINVGSHLVDVSPLSTLGALCIANAPPAEDRDRLFRKLLYYGLSMSLVSAIVCWLFFGVLLQS
ncbi:MAG: C4-dicarboxylate ABC transporter [Anaerolineae bacterium]|nr:C4-dicarboxylate ABC transporter [Anaerolineae bacterium]